MHIFEGNINEVFIKSLQALKNSDKIIIKNGYEIKELYPVIFKITNPKNGILSISNRAYNPAFSIAETYWNLIGDTSNWLTKYNKLYNNYFTNGELIAGYGNRILNWNNKLNQLFKIIDLLNQNPQSQQANITIFNPEFDLDSPKFVPCIILLSFHIKEGKLNMTTTMRAQDIWLGFPYDIHLLLSIFQITANILNVEMGNYNHFCDVLRLYERNYDNASKEIGIIESKYPRLIDLNITTKKSFKELDRFKPFFINPSIEKLKAFVGENEYWINSLKVILIYRLIHDKKYSDACSILNSVTNIWKKQIVIWSKEYHPSFYKLIKL